MTSSPVLSPTSRSSAFHMSPRTVETMARSLKCLLITLKNIDNAIVSPKNFNERNIEILTERKKDLESQIEKLKKNLVPFQIEQSTPTDLSMQIMKKEGIFREAESIHLLPSTSIDKLLFQHSELIHLLKRCKEHAPVEELRLIIDTLPNDAVEQLYYSVWLAHKTPFVPDYGKNAVMENPLILMEIKDPFLFLGCENILEQMICLTEEEIQLEEKKENGSEYLALIKRRKENRHLRFKALFDSPHINQKQLKKIYNRLDPEVKTQVPPPPYFGHGVQYELYKTLGAHQTSQGTVFQVMAPRAKNVSVALRAHGKDELIFPMQKEKRSGIWSVNAKDVQTGQMYQYIIETENGDILRKADPFSFGFASYHDPFRHESIVRNLDFQWNDNAWMEHRAKLHLKPQPITIYEVHLTSWRKNGNHPMTYREHADIDNPNSLISYCKRLKYTHVELMGILEHPQDVSWGYQVTGYFAPNHRLGSLEDFQYLVNQLHQHHIGVFLDWVPAHFANDSFALVYFDGSALFEHPDPRRGDMPTWGTKIFNYENEFVRNFLISSAYFWAQEMHIDGLRVDAVTSMIYLDFDKPTDWLPNHKHGHLNLGALWFMKDLNTVIHNHFPGVITIAEELSNYPNITAPVTEKGLNFDLKWGMAWLNDALQFFREDYHFRPHHFDKLVNTVQHVEADKRIVLSLSHDEVAHGKNSIIDKMPGDTWRKFANTRLLFSYQYCRPGKKLLFQGNDIGQMEEWSFRLLKSLQNPHESHLEAVQWNVLDPNVHPNTAHFSVGLQQLVQDLNDLCHSHSALWEKDGEHDEISWIHDKDRQNQVISYHRSNKNGQQLACVHNFSANAIENYIVSFAQNIPHLARIQEILNSDSHQYGGSGVTNSHVEILRDPFGNAEGFKIRLAPLATMIFEEQFA